MYGLGCKLDCELDWGKDAQLPRGSYLLVYKVHILTN